MADSKNSAAFCVAVVHWFPLEQYPPVTNLLNCLGNNDRFSVTAYSTHFAGAWKTYAHSEVRVVRTSFPKKSLRRLQRFWAFIFFPVATLIRLLWLKPQILLYFEPHSAVAAWLYCLINRRCRLFIHYHEYREPSHYRQKGMRVAAIGHALEKRSLYRRAEWISHTNADRVRMFLEDLPGVARNKLRTLANRPPRDWFGRSCVSWPAHNEPLSLVYVGAVSLTDTFVKEVIDWLRNQPAVTLDLYAGSVNQKTSQLLTESQCEQFRFFPDGVSYSELPELLPRYHVGLILYRGCTQNYIYNAPNKLFEYLACGLDVWFPLQMKGVKPFARIDASPRVVETDFDELQNLDLVGLRERPSTTLPYSIDCETEAEPLLTAMMFCDP